MEYGTETPDYIIFPQTASLSTTSFEIINSMAPKASLGLDSGVLDLVRVNIHPEKLKTSMINNCLKIDKRQVGVIINFDTTYGCLVSTNDITATMTISGEMEEKETTKIGANYSGLIEISLNIPGKAPIPLRFTKFIYYQ